MKHKPTGSWGGSCGQRILRGLAAVACVLASTTAFSQGVFADLTGVISDPTGAVIGGAVVSLTGVDTGRIRTARADSLGRYRVPALAAGDYRIEVEANGFGKLTRVARLAVGEAAVVDLELQLADVNETVFVVSAAPRSSSGLSEVIDQKQIVDLPLNGRDLQQLAFLQPNVSATTNRGSANVYMHGMKLNINGAGPRSNAFLLDGTTVADFYNNGFGSVAGPVLGVDAVREFRVLTDGYSAAYGGVVGGVISVVTKAGSNSFQGSLFVFMRNDALDARNFFDAEKPDFSRHQFGLSLGGPLVANRTFFFAAGEGLNEHLGLTKVTTVPSMQAREGRLVAINPTIQPYLDLFPLPNGRDFGGGLAELSFGAIQDSKEGFGQLRVDHALSRTVNVFGRYTFDEASKNEPTAFPGLPIDWDSRDHFATTQADQVVSQNVVNTVRVGFSLTDIGQTDVGPRTSSSLAVIAGRPVPQLQIGGMPNYGTLTASVATARQDVWSVANDLTISRGRHFFKVGALLDRYSAVQDYRFYWAGRYTFPSIQRFLQDTPSTVLIALPDSDPVRGLASMQFGTYVQDEFHIGANLTANIGVRWDLSTEPTEARGLLVALPDPLHDKGMTLGTLFKNHKANIGPRIGLSWKPESRTMLSGTAGRFFDINTLPYIAQLLNNPPYFNQVTIANPAFPNTAFGTAQPSVSIPSYDWKTPEMWHYSLSVERELGENMAVAAAYAGSRGFNLVRTGDANMPVPVLQADGSPFFPAGAPRRNTSFGTISLRNTDGVSWYDALILSARRRLNSGFQFQAGYTLSRAIDDMQGTLPIEAVGSVTQLYYPDMPSFDHGPSDFDRRHNLHVNAVWDLPFFRSPGGWATGLLRNWTLTGIFTAQSGNPFTPGVQADYSRTLARVAITRPDVNPNFSGQVIQGGPDQYFNPAAFKLQTQGRLGNVPRNSLTGPGLVTLDAAAFRNILVPRLEGKMRLQLRLEVFNALNRANFGLPQRIVFAGSVADEAPLANAGRITTTTTSGRQIQVAAKLLW